jgi:hypothetical protein
MKKKVVRAGELYLKILSEQVIKLIFLKFFSSDWKVVIFT